MLEPLVALRGLKQVYIAYRCGSLWPSYVRNLVKVMRSDLPMRGGAVGGGNVGDAGGEKGEDEKEVGEMKKMREVCCGVGVGIGWR